MLRYRKKIYKFLICFKSEDDRENIKILHLTEHFLVLLK